MEGEREGRRNRANSKQWTRIETRFTARWKIQARTSRLRRISKLELEREDGMRGLRGRGGVLMLRLLHLS